jgi:hypothetical protein
MVAFRECVEGAMRTTESMQHQWIATSPALMTTSLSFNRITQIMVKKLFLIIFDCKWALVFY